MMLDFIDKKFNLSKTSKYKLSIQVSLDGFLFGIFDNDNICLAAKSFNIENNNLNNLFSAETILKKQFAAVDCVVVNQKSTIVPNIFFDKHKSYEYLMFVCNNIDGDEIFSSKIKKLNAHCVFAINRNICRSIRKYHPQTEFYNQTIPLVHSALTRKGKNMFVYFDSNIIDIVVAKNENLLLQNSFKVETVNDAIYFAAAVREQVGIEINTIYLSGRNSKHAEEEFLMFFRQTKLEMNYDLALDITAENALRLTILEKLNKCVS